MFDPYLTSEPSDNVFLVPDVALPPTPVEEHVGDLVAGALRHAAESFLAHDSGQGTDSRDAEDLHASRVALRRIRSLLRTFRALFQPEWASTARADIGWFSQLLGEVRNLDVLALRITLHTEPGADPLALESLFSAVALQRSDVTFRLASARVFPRYGTVLNHIDQLVSAQMPVTARAGEETRAALGPFLRRPWRNVRAAARESRRAPTEANLHALRIRSKELRYAAELASRVFGQTAQELASAATAVQDRLGDHRDALAAVAFLTQAAGERFECAFVAGQLVVTERLAAAKSLKGLKKDVATLKDRWTAFGRSLPTRGPIGPAPQGTEGRPGG
ncbi:MAG TPA: CHAD domain-containing protein [Acidimicrobiales bacterium]|nr:CHAD domain-containing protein [Acidimicrobiales bacterium]